MWIFTDTGFVSAVRKTDNPEHITVRSRDRESLESILAHTGGEVVRSPHGDYPYRAFVDPGKFATWVADVAGNLNYDNFKSQVARTRGHSFAHSLHDVWAAMLDVEDDEARS